MSLDALVQLFRDITAALDLQVMLLDWQQWQCSLLWFKDICAHLASPRRLWCSLLSWMRMLPMTVFGLVNAEFDPLLRNNRDSIIKLNTSLWAQRNASSLPVMIKHNRFNKLHIFFSYNSFTVDIIASGETGCYLLSSAGKTPATCKQLLVKSLKRLAFVLNGN